MHKVLVILLCTTSEEANPSVHVTRKTLKAENLSLFAESSTLYGSSSAFEHCQSSCKGILEDTLCC